MQGQTSLFDLNLEVSTIKHKKKIEPELRINFSCFSTFRNEFGGVRYGECFYNHDCQECEARKLFYEKAEEYQKSGEAWGVSVALAKEFFEIPTVSEYTVAAYRNGIEFKDGQWQPKYKSMEDRYDERRNITDSQTDPVQYGYGEGNSGGQEERDTASGET